MAQGNQTFQKKDHTKHAESVLASRFCQVYHDDPEFMANSTLYSSMEPCAMCMFTMFKAGIGRVVYGLRAPTACMICFNRLGTWPRTNISSHDCALLMSKPMVVQGPYLEDEAAAIVEDCFKRHLGSPDKSQNGD